MEMSKYIKEDKKCSSFFCMFFDMEIFTKGNFGNIDYNKL